MEQNQNDNASNVAMGWVTRSDATLTVDIIDLRSKMAAEMPVNGSYQI